MRDLHCYNPARQSNANSSRFVLYRLRHAGRSSVGHLASLVILWPLTLDRKTSVGRVHAVSAQGPSGMLGMTIANLQHVRVGMVSIMRARTQLPACRMILALDRSTHGRREMSSRHSTTGTYVTTPCLALPVPVLQSTLADLCCFGRVLKICVNKHGQYAFKCHRGVQVLGVWLLIIRLVMRIIAAPA